MTFEDIKTKREELAECTSDAYKRLQGWIDKSVKITGNDDAEAVMEHVYCAAEDLVSCRKEEMLFLEDPYKYMCKD